MGLGADVALLAFYALTFLLYLAVTAAQFVLPGRDARATALGVAMKLLLRMGLAAIFYFPVARVVGRMLGYQLAQSSETRRGMIVDRVFTNGPRSTPASPLSPQPVAVPPAAEALETEQLGGWEGIIGFFHPFCNAGGGGERVLWAAIKATQEKHPRAICVVYTGDHDASKPQIIARVKERFNIELESTRLFFLYLSARHYVQASTWPRFTLFGQSIGSIILAFDAFQLLVPDVFIDTMGYGFALGCARFLFPTMPTGAYVHYPTISTDMLGALESEEGKGLHAGAGAGWQGLLKKTYWRLFAWAYSMAHIQSLWGPYRKPSLRKSGTRVVFPPCAVEELEEAIMVDATTEGRRENIFIYIAQFRPEKNHKMILEAFAEFVRRATESGSSHDVKLALIGSVRDSEDATRVYELRLLAHELKIKDQVEFVCDASWPEILQWLQKGTAGVNGMWNEHFGIGVVEYEAAGLISVVNDSGGPKLDIVVEYNGGPTGFHANTASEYAAAFAQVMAMSPKDKLAMRQRARASAQRFTEAEFAKSWNEEADRLLELVHSPPRPAFRESQLLAGSFLLLLAYDVFQLLR